MTCDDARPLLGAYHDGELDAVRSVRIEEHLRACAECTVALENLSTLSAATKTSSFSAPPDLRANVLAALHADATDTTIIHARFPMAGWIPKALALAAAILLGFFVAQAIYRPAAKQALLAQLTDSHLRSLIGTHLIDVATSDSHTVRPWFEGKLDFAPPVEDLSADGFALVGGRVDYIGGRGVAVLVYQRRQHFVNLFIWPQTGNEGPITENPQRGYNVLHWTKGGLTFWALSEVSENDLRTFVGTFSRNR